MCVYVLGIQSKLNYCCVIVAGIFRHPSFNVLFEMSPLQPLQTGVCFMSLQWK